MAEHSIENKNFLKYDLEEGEVRITRLDQINIDTINYSQFREYLESMPPIDDLKYLLDKMIENQIEITCPNGARFTVVFE